MQLANARTIVLGLGFIWIAAYVQDSAVAQVLPLTPNGNPTGPASATSSLQPDNGIYTVSLNPNQIGTAFLLPPAPPETPSISLHQILNNSLAAQNSLFSVGGNFQIQGNIRLDNYFAWADTRPAVTQGSLGTFDAVDYPAGKEHLGAGGAVLGLHYIPSGTDPTNVRWLQLIHTNFPNPNVPSWDHPYDAEGWVWQIDNGGAVNPFYGESGDVLQPIANSTDFIDAVAREYRDLSRWRGYLFLATIDPENPLSINVCGAAYWGFDDPVVMVPEPGTLALTFVATLALWKYRRSTYRCNSGSGELR